MIAPSPTSLPDLQMRINLPTPGQQCVFTSQHTHPTRTCTRHTETLCVPYACVTCQRMIFAVRLRVYVCGWQPTRPSDLAEYLLIWHRKKRGRPIARDYTDLHEHTRAHARICWHVFCTLRNPKKTPMLSATHRLIRGGLAHSDIGISVSVN